ncbi:MAG: hypothetical protein ACYC2E_17710 [Sulfuricella sp.]
MSAAHNHEHHHAHGETAGRVLWFAVALTLVYAAVEARRLVGRFAGAGGVDFRFRRATRVRRTGRVPISEAHCTAC